MTSDLDHLRAALRQEPGSVAIGLLGEPNWAASTMRELRWGTRGSLALVLTGDRVGLWHDHETGEGGDILALIQRVRACGFPEAVEIARGLVAGHLRAEPPTGHPKRRRQNGATLDLVRRIWRETRPADGTLVERYLNGRGIQLPHGIPDLRFHPECPRQTDRLPAMVGAMRDIRTNEIVGLHRTFLDLRGRKLPERSKQMLGTAKGAAVKLSDDSDVTGGLGIVEGIETGLACLSFGFAPVWACGSAGGIASFPVLPGIESLTIFADHDPAGLAAAEACTARWRAEGREVVLYRSVNEREDIADLRMRAARW